MKNITVSVDDETYRRARIKAAERDTSVSALVRDFLNGIAATESEHDRFQRLKAEEKALRAGIKGFSASENLPRDALYERGRS